MSPPENERKYRWPDGQVREEAPYRCGAFVTSDGEQCNKLSDHEGDHTFGEIPWRANGGVPVSEFSRDLWARDAMGSAAFICVRSGDSMLYASRTSDEDGSFPELEVFDCIVRRTARFSEPADGVVLESERSRRWAAMSEDFRAALTLLAIGADDSQGWTTTDLEAAQALLARWPDKPTESTTRAADDTNTLNADSATTLSAGRD